MRIWDLDPGYLNRGSLLAEHRELHALVRVLERQLTRFAAQPELIRWRQHRPALALRHQALVVEMRLRGIGHHSPLDADVDPASAAAVPWPAAFVSPPAEQFQLLRRRYQHKPQGRIPLPRSVIELWAQHKYSVMAREPHLAKQLGQRVGAKAIDFAQLASELVLLLRQVPQPGRLHNAVQHMWGYVDHFGQAPPGDSAALLTLVQRLSLEHQVDYLCASTALGELARHLLAPS